MISALPSFKSDSLNDYLTDPSPANTLLLMRGNGSDNGTLFTDNSSYNRTFAAFGNARTRTDNKKFGTASMYFDGTGDYIRTTNVTGFNLGSAINATFAAWVYPLATGTPMTIIDKSYDWNSGQVDFRFEVNTLAGLSLYVGAGSGNAIFTNVYSVPAYKWTHVAVAINNGFAMLFIDGLCYKTKDMSAYTMGAYSSEICVGSTSQNGTRVNFFNGYIDQLMIKNKCLYTDDFIAPIREW